MVNSREKVRLKPQETGLKREEAGSLVGLNCHARNATEGVPYRFLLDEGSPKGTIRALNSYSVLQKLPIAENLTRITRRRALEFRPGTILQCCGNCRWQWPHLVLLPDGNTNCWLVCPYNSG